MARLPKLVWVSIAGLLLVAPHLWAAAPFPRGPGYYYDPFKLAAILASFLAWVKLCAWVDVDAKRFNLDRVRWNSLLLGGGVAAFFLIWSMGGFWFMLTLSVIGVGGVFGWYVAVRNPRAPQEERMFTKSWFQNFLKKLTSPRKPATAGAEEEDKPETLPLRFMSRSTAGEEEDTDRVDRLAQSKGYKAALEMVWSAIQRRATDIHLEPTAGEMSVRFRIDGMMTNVKPFTRSMGDAVVNIFKVLCNLDITEKRKPQDGSFSAEVEDRLVEFRVATAGSVAGEKLVMRVLDASAQLADLANVGMTDFMQTQVREVISKPHGLILVCGPTGSGKSTTLYACLHEIDRFQQNIITVENPVEYRLDGITQIEVNPKAGKTFAGELRSILRQDPDVILIGEIRDKETAEIACQAAQTGHLVFSTVHANDSVTAIARMIDLGVPPFMLSSALVAVLAQRLVRRLCKKCRKRIKPSPETLKKLKIDADAVRYLYRAFDPVEDAPKKTDDAAAQLQICAECGGNGYLKRTGIFEFLIVNNKIRDLIRENPNINEIRRVATIAGLRTLFEDGARLVIDGDTSIQELLRVSK